MPKLKQSWLKNLCLAVSLVTATGQSAKADPQPVEKLNDSAQQAYDQGKFKKAVISWTKALKALEDAGQKDIFVESCLRRLGQAYRKIERSVDAYKVLKQALEMCNALGVADKELAQEMSEISTSYRPVDVNQLGSETAAQFKKANVTDVGLMRASDGSKMQVNLEEKFEKHLDNDAVDGIQLDKHVTVDINQAADGTVSMTNIKGFRIHAREVNIWVNLLGAIIKPADAEGQHPAEVTAGKMGVTKTVTASLPSKGFQPLNELLVQLRAMSTPLTITFANGLTVDQSPNSTATTTSIESKESKESKNVDSATQPASTVSATQSNATSASQPDSSTLTTGSAGIQSDSTQISAPIVDPTTGAAVIKLSTPAAPPPAKSASSPDGTVNDNITGKE